MIVDVANTDPRTLLDYLAGGEGPWYEMDPDVAQPREVYREMYGEMLQALDRIKATPELYYSIWDQIYPGSGTGLVQTWVLREIQAHSRYLLRYQD